MVIFRSNAIQSLKYQKIQLIGFIGCFMFLELQMDIAVDRVGRKMQISSRLTEHFQVGTV